MISVAKKSPKLSILASIKHNIIIICFIIFAIGMLIIDTGGYNLKLYYSDKTDTTVRLLEKIISYNNQKILSEENSFELSRKSGAYYIKSSQWTRKNNNLDLVFRWEEVKEANSDIIIQKIEFRLLFIPIFCIDYTNYSDYFRTEQHIYLSDQKEIYIVPEDQTATISFDSNDLYNLGHIQNRIILVKTVIVIFLLLFGLFVVLVDIQCVSKDQAFHIKWSVILIVICSLVFYSSFNGSKNASPDEDVSTGAVKYYYTNWGLPDYESKDAAATYSDYGSSRLKEMTPYYWIAGKTGALFETLTGINNGTRLFNAILFFLLCLLYILKGKNHKWLLIGLIFTPQLWYIFSYTTSDAWDYFLCYLLIASLAYKHDREGKVSFSVFQGILLGLILLGKEIFYVVVLYTGFYKIIDIYYHTQKRKALFNLFILLISAVIIYSSRRILDFVFYDGMKSKIMSGVGKNYRTIHYIAYRNKGVDLYFMLANTNFLERVFKSFTGLYGWMEVYSGELWYCCIGLLYITLIIYIVRHVLKMKQTRLNIELCLSLGMIPLMLTIVLMKCWTADYQAQGRYLFGVIPCIMIFLSKTQFLLSSRKFEYLIESLMLIGIVSFVCYQMTVIC